MRILIPESQIRAEIQFRNDFVAARVPYKASPAEMKDLTDFMHGGPASLLSCVRCGLATRTRVLTAANYTDDVNDFDLMEQVYPRYVESFRRKHAYREFFPHRAEVLEIGSHLGAFLQVAEEWNWRARALDVGDDTVAFARGKGFNVARDLPESACLNGACYDAIAIWNCFEQIANPASTLRSVYRMLRPHGLLTLRVPHIDFYTHLQRQFWEGERDSFVVRSLAYNNLLGFPYLFGYTPQALTALLHQHGFHFVRGFNSELVTMPFADLNARLEREQKGISNAVARWSSDASRHEHHLTGPWIELLFRKMTEDDWRRQRAHRPKVSSPQRIDLRFLERAA